MQKQTESLCNLTFRHWCRHGDCVCTRGHLLQHDHRVGAVLSGGHFHRAAWTAVGPLRGLERRL